ncbi:hypothetical protein ACFX1T_005586 [Malus domestica]
MFAISTSAGAFSKVTHTSLNHQPSVSVDAAPAAYWTAPTSPFIKLIVDASWNALSGSSYAGMMVLNADGKFLAATRFSIKANHIAQAEALAHLHGCQLGISLGFRFVILESDSLESISCLGESLENGSWEAYPTLAKVKWLGDFFQDCRWFWVPRSANMVADWIASVRFSKMSDV